MELDSAEVFAQPQNANDNSLQQDKGASKKDIILIAQEIACAQRPALTIIWAASLHAVWYYLNFSHNSFLATCCTVGFAALGIDFSLHYYSKCNLDFKLEPLLETRLREKGLSTNTPKPSTHVLALVEPRTYSELCAIGHACQQRGARITAYLSLLRDQRRNAFTAGIAVTSIVLGSLFNNMSGPCTSYIFVLIIILVPILERMALIRNWVSHFYGRTENIRNQIKSFFASLPGAPSVALRRPMPDSHDSASNLHGKLPKLERRLSVQSSSRSSVASDDDMRNILADHFSQQDGPAIRPSPLRESAKMDIPMATEALAAVMDSVVQAAAENPSLLHSLASMLEPADSSAGARVDDEDNAGLDGNALSFSLTASMQADPTGIRKRFVAASPPLDGDADDFDIVSSTDIEMLSEHDKTD